jgi:uncharacterized membrane protein YkvA (DUF1232 family)
LPLDLIPDVIPILGWLDDVGALALAYRMISSDIAKAASQSSRVQVVDGAVVESGGKPRASSV